MEKCCQDYIDEMSTCLGKGAAGELKQVADIRKHVMKLMCLGCGEALKQACGCVHALYNYIV